MKRLIGVISLLAVLMIALPAVSAACTPTGFIRDGIDMTAKFVNTSLSNVVIDAAPCNIGVYFDQSGTLDKVEIRGANYFGVVANGDVNAISVSVSNSSIHNIGETPFNGTQHGVAVYYRGFGPGSATGSVDGNTIFNYQKGG